MNTNELRFGNLVYVQYPEGNEVVEATKISRFFINGLGCSAIVPIPLTEEWLLKFGFSFQIDSFSIRNLFIVFFENKIECYFKDWAVGHLVKLRNIQYVNQLQNLYFALTGEELEII